MYKNKKAMELDEVLLMNVGSLLSDDISAGSGGHIDDHQTINRVIKNVSIKSVFEAHGMEFTRVSETEVEFEGQKLDMPEIEDFLLMMLAGEEGQFLIPYVDDGLDTPQTYQDLSSIPVGSTLILAQVLRGLPITLRSIGWEIESLSNSLDRAKSTVSTASNGVQQLVRRDALSERGTNVFEFEIQNREIMGLTEMIPPGTMGNYVLFAEGGGFGAGGPTDLSLLSADPGQNTIEFSKLVVAIDDTDKASVLIEDQYDLTIHKSWDTVPADANAVVIEVSRYDGVWADYREVYAIPGAGPRTDLTDSLGFWRLAAYTKRVDPKIVSLESQVEELDGKVSTLESDTTLSDLETEVATLTSTNSTLQDKVSGLETANSTLESTVSDLAARLEALESPGGEV